MIPALLEAVIFDMDGLLLDTEKLYRTAMFSTGARLGLPMTEVLHQSLLGTPRDTGDALLMAHFGAAFDLDAYHLTCSVYFDDLCRVEVPLRPGVVPLLDVLACIGVPAGVATSTSRPKAEEHLRKAGILDRFAVLVTRSDVSQGKPHPESFLTAATALKAQPNRCLALEDSHNGVRAAAAAGMATIMIPDLLAPTDAIRALCVGVLPSLLDVAALLALPQA